MACEIEQQQLDAAVANLSQAEMIRNQAASDLQQAEWAVQAAQAQFLMASMVLVNCLNGGGGFGQMQMKMMQELQAASKHPDTFRAKVSELRAQVDKSNAVK